MKYIKLTDYHSDLVINDNNLLSVFDHLSGFNQKYFSNILDNVIHLANHYDSNIINTGYVFDSRIKNQYPTIKFLYKQNLVGGYGWENMIKYTVHPKLEFSNFLCSFNGSAHVSRKFLVAILKRFGYFNPDYCSKNFVFTSSILDGHISDYSQSLDRYYRKFFIATDSDAFFNDISSFGHVRFAHDTNIYNLEHKLAKSFLHIVSETMATSYYPFVTEKFLYSVVTRGLFLAYAQPGWHAHLEKYYGFKPYTNLFDYRFDSIQNPVERLVELVTMVSKYSVLSLDDWRDLYLLEQDTIEYNYNHYFSGDYLKSLAKFE